ncbi:MAG: exonuclease SbcCD subunit D [Candidatus Nanohaloarchaea archaeon]
MKVSIVSDTHFGFRWGEEREDDSFRNAREALERSLDADIILMPGDIFDRKIPKQEVLDRATEVLSIPMDGDRSVETNGALEMDGDGIPVVAIHGTHERRPEAYTNPIELMESAGRLVHLDLETRTFEKDGEKVAVHGMSGVPESRAPEVLEEWSPEPVEDAFNILMIHQSIEGFVYTSGDALTMEDLPGGFDLIVDGHIHWYDLERREKPLILPGSTLTTQLRKVEAEKPKGFVTLDTTEGRLKFNKLNSARDVYYVERQLDGEPWSEIKQGIADDLSEIEGEMKPLVNLKLEGKTSARINIQEIRDMFDNLLLSVNRDIERPGTSSTGEEIDPAKEGQELLEENIDTDLDIDHEQFFELLQTGDVENALNTLEKAHDRENRG